MKGNQELTSKELSTDEIKGIHNDNEFANLQDKLEDQYHQLTTTQQKLDVAVEALKKIDEECREVQLDDKNGYHADYKAAIDSVRSIAVKAIPVNTKERL